MAISLKTNCDTCIHKNVCKNVGRARIFINRLLDTTYGDGPNDNYGMGAMSEHYRINIDVSCKDFQGGHIRSSSTKAAGNTYSSQKERINIGDYENAVFNGECN